MFNPRVIRAVKMTIFDRHSGHIMSSDETEKNKVGVVMLSQIRNTRK